MGSSESERFPSTSHVMELVDLDAPAAMTIPGMPACQVRVLPPEKRVEALVLGDNSEPAVSGMKFIVQHRVLIDGESWNAIGATWTHTPFEAYLFVCDVLDRVQLMQESLATATAVVLQGMSSLLRRQSALSREQEVGLLGELLVLESLLNSHSPEDALAMWRGPESEEHDFSLYDSDIEVKTTTSEERTHWISSTHQLSPVGSRPLMLVSIQLTPKMGLNSVALPNLIDHLGGRFGSFEVRFRDKLEAVGYLSDDADLYTTEWALRNPVAFYAVDDDFPKLTPKELSELRIRPNQIKAVRYQVDLSTVKPDLLDGTPEVQIPDIAND